MQDRRRHSERWTGEEQESDHGSQHGADADRETRGSSHGHQPQGRGHEGDNRGRHGGGRGRRGGREGRGRGRARRGEARYILLDVLRDGPKHGYEIIKTLEERSAGRYVPSPGTVYPTLQYLEDQGLVRADQDAERKVYELTDLGKAELVAQAEPIAAFWSRFGSQENRPGRQPEVRFLEEELDHLNRIVWNGLSDAIAKGDQTQVRRVREAVEACQSQVRDVLASNA